MLIMLGLVIELLFLSDLGKNLSRLEGGSVITL